MDREIREQQIAISHENGSYLVSASAGSGKTFVMLSRLVRLIKEKKATMENVLCVTFTEAAATSMKNKLKKALADEIKKTGDKDLMKELSKISTAEVSTLHAFVSKLIRANFFIAEVSPDFTIADATYSDELKSKAIEKVFSKLYSELTEEKSVMLSRFIVGRKDVNLKNTVMDLYEYTCSEADSSVFLNKIKFYYKTENFTNLLKKFKECLDSELQAVKEKYKELLTDLKDNGIDKGVITVETTLLTLEGIIKNPDPYYVKNYETKTYSQAVGKIDEDKKYLQERIDKINKNLINVVKKYSASLTDREEDLARLSQSGEITDFIIGLVNEFTEEYGKLKREENLLDFNDLEKYALKILKDENTLQSVKSKYKYIFVDEYQDINGVQEQILSLLNNDNIFMVGDVKQSIYGFRGCRPEFFIDKYDKMSDSEDRTILLNYNFRSAKKVIDTVNEIFSFCMKKENFGIDYENTSKLIYGDAYGEGYNGKAQFHVVYKHKTEGSKSSGKVYNLLDEYYKIKEEVGMEEVNAVADIIDAEIHDSYYEIDKNPENPEKSIGEKRIEYSDITVLVRSTTGAEYTKLIEGLKARHIPISINSDEKILDYPEIKALVCLLQLICNYRQDIPLATVLKSPIAGLSDEDLLEISMAYKKEENEEFSFFDAYEYYKEKGEDPLKTELMEFDKYFSRIRALSDFMPAQDVLNLIIGEKDIKAHVLASKFGDIKFERIERFIFASRFNGKKLSVREFLERISNNPNGLKFSSNIEDNSVNITTIHASKGLEYPVVIVYGLNKKANKKDESKEILTDRDYGFAVKYYKDGQKEKFETPIRTIIKHDLEVKREKDEMRLFYVALTRAKYSLHLTYLCDEDNRSKTYINGEKFIDFIPKYLPATEETDKGATLNANLKRQTVVVGKTDSAMETEIERNLSFSYPYGIETVLPVKCSVTKANEFTEGEPVYRIEDRIDDGLEGRTDAERGIIAHKILQNIDLNNIINAKEEVQKLIDNGILLKEEIDKIDVEKIYKVLKSPIFSDLENKQVYREKSFLSAIPASVLLGVKSEEKILVQGIIDLLIIDSEGAHVIDYKYTKRKSESLISAYKKQLDLYAYAVENGIKEKVKSKTIISLLTGESVLIN